MRTDDVYDNIFHTKTIKHKLKKTVKTGVNITSRFENKSRKI